MNDTETFLYLTTIGHKSGQPHLIEIWYVELAGCYYLISERRENAHWVQNIQHQPSVTVSVGTRADYGQPQPVTGRIIREQAETERHAQVCALMDAKYGW